MDMPEYRVAAFLVLGALGLAGCGGSSQPSKTELPLEVAFDVLATSFVGAEARLTARSNTAFIPPFIEGMPTTGDVRYLGFMSARLATPGGDTVLYGEAAVDTDFSANSVTGVVTDFVGHDRTGSIAGYDGTIVLTNGKIGIERPNDFRVDYSGILTGNNEAVGLSGTIGGDFKGDPIRGLLGYDSDPLAVVDGVITEAQIGLAVETQ